MKHITYLLLFVCLFGCREVTSVKTGLEGNIMPVFNLLLMDSSSQLNTSTIRTDYPIVFLLFSPDCPYCRALIQEIVADSKLLHNIRFYLLSPLSFTQIKNYYEDYQLYKYPSLTVGQDCQLYFSKYFKVPGVPYLAIYGTNKRLKQVLIGKVSTKEIKAIALE